MLMAMATKWLCSYVWLFLFVSCSNGDHLTHEDSVHHRYEVLPSFPLHYSDIVLKTNYLGGDVRVKRYLAGNFEDPSWGMHSLASDAENLQDSGGSHGSTTESSTSNNVSGSNATLNNASGSNATKSTNATTLSAPVNASESKTGGNYVSVHDATAAQPSIQNTSSLVNQTVNSANVTAVNVSAVIPTAASNVTAANNNNMNINSSQSTDDITIDAIDGNLNLTEHNITKTQQDSHVYYNSTFNANDENLSKHYWVDMDTHPNTQINDMLSQSHRRAATVKLSFGFPFYGHIVTNVTIATGGFVYTGDYVHSWLAATQYIAPLMANFDTSLSNESFVKYMDNGTQFTVEWDKVKLQDKPESGSFTFQATLRKNGDITFVYQSVPIVISNITDENHPVKVGLSDAYIIDKHVLFVRRKTIYEYHRITFEHLSISNWTVINLVALPTCPQATDCESCVTAKIGFDCSWCSEISKCSNGIDRNTQEWSKCNHSIINSVSMCSADRNISDVKSSTIPQIIHGPDTMSGHGSDMISGHEPEIQTEQTVTAMLADESSSMSVSAVIGIFLCLGILMSLSLWGLYAYRNPHTTSGQLLIKYRPSQWSWRRGEARYTAATIHM